jgi:hypothetical protein
MCRGIELVYAIERAIEILSQPLCDGPAAVPHTPRDGEGYGLVEAPRGPLIHHYVIENGLIAKAEFIIPTVHNLLAIERAEGGCQPPHQLGGSTRELDRAVGRVVRAFDLHRLRHALVNSPHRPQYWRILACRAQSAFVDGGWRGRSKPGRPAAQGLSLPVSALFGDVGGCQRTSTNPSPVVG